MTLTAAIIANVIADIALLGGLTYLMSRASRLTPHLDSTTTPTPAARQAERARERHLARPRSALAPAYAAQTD